MNADGTQTAICEFVPKQEAQSVFVVFPAMGIFGTYYQNIAEELVDKGFHVYTADLRGNGKSTLRPSRKVDFGYADQLDQEYSSILSHVQKAHPQKRVFLLGHSLGGQLACLMAARKTHRIDGLVLIACCSVYYRGWSGMGRIRTLFGTQFLRLVSSVVGYLPGKQVGFGGLEAKTVIKDWGRQARSGKYRLKNDPLNYEKALTEVELPVLAVSIEGDALAPPKAVDHLLGKMKSAKAEHLQLKKENPNNEGYNHFNWVKKPKGITRVITDWHSKLN